MFVPGNLSYVFQGYIQDQCVNCFENNTMKLSINEAKLTGLWARNCAAIKQVSNLKFAFGPKSYRKSRKTGPWTGPGRRQKSSLAFIQSPPNTVANVFLSFKLQRLMDSKRNQAVPLGTIVSWEIQTQGNIVSIAT